MSSDEAGGYSRGPEDSDAQPRGHADLKERQHSGDHAERDDRQNPYRYPPTEL